jgi:predicted molibdopterin-dependent oxidoreductase YjgC
MTRRAKGPSERYPASLVEINPVDADKLNIADGQDVLVASRRGEVKAKAQITEKSAPERFS